MRLMWVIIVVGVAAVSCTDKQANERPSATPGSATTGAATPATPTPAAPTLPADTSFDQAAWAASAEQQVRAVAPQLTNLTCERMQCEGTLTARTESELMDAVEKLLDDHELRAIDGFKSFKQSLPEQRGDRHEMKVFVRFNRE
jgi:hypothetical protein